MQRAAHRLLGRYWLVWKSIPHTEELRDSLPDRCCAAAIEIEPSRLKEVRILDNKQMIEAIRAQEKSLILPGLSHDAAWQLGEWLRARALSSDLPLYIEVFVNGGVRFAAASPRAHNNLAEWVRRKRNLVLRMGQSSYLTDLIFKQWGISLEAFGMSQADHGLGGGSFPLHVADIGIIGALTISGLPSIDDHNLVVECLAEHLGQDFAGLKLTQPASA